MAWYPSANKTIVGNSGGSYTGGPFKGLLHTTEGSSASGAIGAFRSNNSWPHFLINYEGTVWQFLDTAVGARALRNLSGGVQTNRDSVIQLEVVGFAGRPNEHPAVQMGALRALMIWIEQTTGVKPIGPGRSFATAYGQSSLRFTNAQWDNFNGWCGHCHAPENQHWDPGAIDINYLLIRGIKPMFDPAECFAEIRTDPTNGGWIALKPDGAVFNGAPSVFYGGMNGSPHFAGRTAAKILFPGDADWVNDGSAYKYRVVATSGEVYGLPT